MALVNKTAAGLGLPANFTDSKLSQSEKGRRDLSARDLAVLEVIDPQHRSWKFWAFGWEVADYEQLIDPQRDRKLTEQEEQRALRAADAKRAGKAAKKGRRASPGSA